MRHPHWHLFSALLLALIGSACDTDDSDGDGTDDGGSDGGTDGDINLDVGFDAIEDGGGDTNPGDVPADTGEDSVLGDSDTAEEPPPDGGGDTIDIMEEPCDEDAPGVCVDCACLCSDGEYQLFAGGCFGPCEEIPECPAEEMCPPDYCTCPDVACAFECPLGNWENLDGCTGCACAPPELDFMISDFGLDVENVTFRAGSDVFIGGINRYLLNFTWTYDGGGADDGHVVHALIGLMTGDESLYEPSPIAETFFFDPESAGPQEIRDAGWTQNGIAPIDYEVVVTGGYLSIRAVDGRFEGGVYLEMETTDGEAVPILVSAPFDVEQPDL